VTLNRHKPHRGARSVASTGAMLRLSSWRCCRRSAASCLWLPDGLRHPRPSGFTSGLIGGIMGHDRPPAQRAGGVLGKLSSLEVKVFCPT
jgi:hypothetical protein